MDHDITRPLNFEPNPDKPGSDGGPDSNPVSEANPAPVPMPGSPERQILYRCTCGHQLKLDTSIGGFCPNCDQTVSPKMLKHDLAMTMTINPGKMPAGAVASSQADEKSFDRVLTGPLGETRQDTGPFSDEDPKLLIGKSYGHFELVEPLGRGGMGQVYRGLDKSLQRYVAVKVLRSGIGSSNMSSSSDREVDSLLQEAVAQARVTHPNIVTIYYVGKQEGDPFLAMELVNGNPLSKLISAGQLTFSHITPIALQVANALKFSYELDIIHGDIKPSNILVQANGMTKLSDFGMARRASDKSDGRLGGTPNYIAPELLTGAKPSIQSDMYALGVTLYEMTFGRLPVTLSGTTIASGSIRMKRPKSCFQLPGRKITRNRGGICWSGCWPGFRVIVLPTMMNSSRPWSRSGPDPELMLARSRE